MNKKSTRKVVDAFEKNVAEILIFLDEDNLSGFSKKHISWVYEYAIIRLYRDFENFILHCLIAAINQNTQHLTDTTNIEFPEHLTSGVCRYIVVGDGYFDFRGRDGLIKILKKFLPRNHPLVTIISNQNYKCTLEKLSSLRNFAAHNSDQSKKRAINAIPSQKYLASSGSWLKVSNRFEDITDDLISIANDIYQSANN